MTRMDAHSLQRILSGPELRRLLLLRRRIRDEIVRLPRALQREVLRALEEARQRRLHGRVASWTPPEMTAAELIREIKWRIDAASLAEATAGARALDRGHRLAAQRARRTDRVRRSNGRTARPGAGR